jgi:aspartyl-tRNA(Asn)/glutamyl-tRNA(Gln) amidotransferase subunit A
MTDLAYATAEDLRRGFASGAFSPTEVIGALSARIERLDHRLGAFTATCLEEAGARAEAATRRFRRSAGARPLEGIPFVAKDLFDTAGVRTTYGSAIFATHVPRTTAAAVSRLEHAGAILMGKTATHEFGWGITTVSDHGRPTRNPWAPERIAGGSSGGSAVALASFQAPLALGTDTAGSVRIPADFCGVVGFKPSRHAISRAGAFPLAPSLDHIGVMARTPRDAELGFRVAAGLTAPALARMAGLRTIRIGISADLHAFPLDPPRERVLEETTAIATELGARVETIALAPVRTSFEVLATVVLAEGGFVHRTRGLWPQLRADYGPDVRSRLERSEDVDRDSFLAAVLERDRIAETIVAAFERVDVLLAPVSAVGPAPLTDGPGTDRFRRAVMSCTAPASLAGLPACALRGGFDDDGLPVGVQLIGPPGSDLRTLAIAQELFHATAGVQAAVPPLATGG